MADLSIVSNVLLNAAIISGSVFIIGVVIIIAVKVFLDWKKYNTICIIFKRQTGGVPIMSKDMGGVYVEKKTNNKRFFLKHNDVGLNPDDIPYIMNSKGQKIVFLLQTGLKNFRYLNINIPKTWEFMIEVGEEDLNWALNAYERHKHIFGKTLIDKLLPYIGMAIVTVFVLALFAMIMRDFGVLRDVAEAFKQAAQAFAQAKSGQSIIQ